MKVFVTGASGFVGSAVIPELLAAGHSVVGLARSDAAAARVAELGAEVRRGSLDTLDVLGSAAAEADGVIHLAFIHDFADMGASVLADRAAIAVLGDALAGSDRPLAIASGLAALGYDRPVTEDDRPAAEAHADENPRVEAARATLALAERGVRSMVVRLAPTVHGPGDHGFIAAQVAIARQHGFSGYLGDGSDRWPAVHRLDAARLFRLGLEHAPAGSILHGAAEGGVPQRDIARAIGDGLALDTRSVPKESALEHFGWLGRFLNGDMATDAERTRALLDWHPRHPTLLADLAAGHYFG